MSRTWKWVAGIAAALMIAGVLVVVILIAPFLGAGRTVDAEIARIKAAGEPVSADDLTGKPIPDSENAAVVYGRAFKLLPRSTDSPDGNALWDFLDPEKRTSNPQSWTQAKAIVKRYVPALKLAEKAAVMPKCRFPVDWGDPFNGEFQI